MAKAELWKAMAQLYPAARPFMDYVAVEEADGTRPFTVWNLPGSPPTEAQITAAAAAYDIAEAQRQSEAATLRQQVLTVAQSAVGVSITALTAVQVRSLVAILLWKAGALKPDGTVRLLAEWVKE